MYRRIIPHLDRVSCKPLASAESPLPAVHRTDENADSIPNAASDFTPGACTDFGPDSSPDDASANARSDARSDTEANFCHDAVSAPTAKLVRSI